jgi:hypothetical protein
MGRLLAGWGFEVYFVGHKMSPDNQSTSVSTKISSISHQ